MEMESTSGCPERAEVLEVVARAVALQVAADRWVKGELEHLVAVDPADLLHCRVLHLGGTGGDGERIWHVDAEHDVDQVATAGVALRGDRLDERARLRDRDLRAAQ